MKTKSPLAEILSELGSDSEHPKSAAIPLKKVRRWMKSEDIEALGALTSLIRGEKHFQRISPPLTFKDYHPFLIDYYERCIRENPDGEESDSRYTAAQDIISYFTFLWNDPEISRHTVRDFKTWLAKLYKEGDEDVKTCIVEGILEHLFENPAVQDYFTDWKNNSVLAAAYSRAMEWPPAK